MRLDRWLNLSPFVLSLLGVLIVPELEARERGSFRAGGGGVRAHILEEFDADGDGELSEEEHAAARAAREAKLLEKFDVDGDGELSEEERMTARESFRGRRKPWRHRKHRRFHHAPCLLAEFDVDGDGELSSEERDAARAARHARLLAEFDADGDGELSEAEHSAAREARREQLLAEFDSDDDGELSRDERRAARAAREAECLGNAGGGETGDGEVVAAALVEVGGEPMFQRGDANQDRRVDISDPIAILDFLFSGTARLSCMDAADANDDGTVNISDPTTLLLNLFSETSAIPEPFSILGSDPTADGLSCGAAS